MKIRSKTSISKGDSANSLFISMPNHIGTHIDAPKHFFDNGKTIDQYLASFWIFSSVRLVDIPLVAGEFVKVEHLEGRLDNETDCLLIRTGFEKWRGERIYWERNPGVSAEVGSWLKNNYPKVRILGIDTISVSSWVNRPIGREAHRALLSGADEILLIEDMRLSELESSSCINEIVVAPMLVSNGDGAPCTIIARINDEN